MLEGQRDQNIELARVCGAQPDPQHVEFTTVEIVSADLVLETGEGQFRGVRPYPVRPVSFVRFNERWRLFRDYVGGWLDVFDTQQVCA